MNILAKESYYQTWNLQEISKKKYPIFLQMEIEECLGYFWTICYVVLLNLYIEAKILNHSYLMHLKIYTWHLKNKNKNFYYLL